MSNIQWIESEVDNNLVERLSNQYGINKLLTQVMLNRGLTEQDIINITYNSDEAIIDPSLLTNGQQAAEEILEFARNHPEGLIYVRADYDCDGVTSAYIMGRVLTYIHENVFVDVPQRSEGYGLTLKKSKEIVAASEGKPVLVITVDNGVNCIDQVDYLRANNVQVIVTDHHEPLTDARPNCTVVDPHCYESDPFKHLAGCGVAYKVCQLILRACEEENLIDELLPILAIGTIADMMPMTVENIILVKKGLDIINSENCPTPLQAFKKFHGKDRMSFDDIGWELAPALNACGRMGNTKLAAHFLFADGDVQEITNTIVTEIVGLNIKRKESTDKKTAEALRQVNNDSSINIVKLDGCPEGLAGVVANKVLQHNNKPTVVLIKHESDTLVGSARGIGNISILDILKEEDKNETLVKFGGHDAAAGISVKEDKFDKLAKTLVETTDKYLETLDLTDTVDTITLHVDSEITMNEVTLETLSAIHQVPYDKSNFSAPIFKIRAQIVSCEPTAKNPANGWLTLKGRNNKDIKFWVADIMEKYIALNGATEVFIYGTLEKNFMRGTPVIIKVMDMKAY